ncbi:hypothetical protein MHYP_G00340800 [Metynnis hypsauchen]
MATVTKRSEARLCTVRLLLSRDRETLVYTVFSQHLTVRVKQQIVAQNVEKSSSNANWPTQPVLCYKKA